MNRTKVRRSACSASQILQAMLVVLITRAVRTEFRFEKIAIIDEFIVKDELRGKGIGHELLIAAENEAKKAGCRRIELHSAIHRLQTHEFYKSNGYEGTSLYF